MKEGQPIYTSQPNKSESIAKPLYPLIANNGATSRPLPTVGQYCRSIGLKLKPYTEWKKSDCPFCGWINGFLIRPDCGAFKCRKCGAHGNGLIQLHMQLHRLTYYKAYNQLAAWVGAMS